MGRKRSECDMEVMGIQEFTAPSPKFHPELSGLSRKGNKTRNEPVFLEEAETGSDTGCQRAFPGSTRQTLRDVMGVSSCGSP